MADMGDELSPRFGKPLAVPANSPPVLELSPMHAVAAPPKLGGQLMKALGAAAPLGPRLQHVKRVRKQEQQGRPPQLEILLCPLDWQEQQQGGGCQAAGQAQPAPGPPDGEQPQVESQVAAPAAADAEADTERPLLPEAVKAIVQQHGLQPYTVQVPLYAPLTREQLAEWSAHWPLTWRPPDAATAPHLQELPAEEVEVMQRHMRATWRLAQQAGTAGGIVNACILVDPARDAVVAAAADCSHEHPLRHAAMAAVAAAAEWQRRTWPHDGQQQQQQEGQAERRSAGGNGSCLSAAQQQQPAATATAAVGAGASGDGELASSGEGSDGKRRRLEGSHDVRDAAHEAAAPADGSGLAHPHLHKHHAEGQQPAAAAGAAPAQAVAAGLGAAPRAAAAEGQDAGPGPRPYLCTGYDAYLVHEPCVMCAMALVHSRLRRVAFCLPSGRWGALGGAYALHAQRSLNHHYQVYRLPLQP